MRLAVSRLVLKRRCHQGPFLGPHPHMKNAFLMAGPQCETWMRLYKPIIAYYCQENKRKVPESPLLTAGAAILEAFPSSSNSVAPFLGPVFGPIFGTTKEQTGVAHGPDFVHLLAPAFLLQCQPPWTHTHTSV